MPTDPDALQKALRRADRRLLRRRNPITVVRLDSSPRRRPRPPSFPSQFTEIAPFLRERYRFGDSIQLLLCFPYDLFGLVSRYSFATPQRVALETLPKRLEFARSLRDVLRQHAAAVRELERSMLESLANEAESEVRRVRKIARGSLVQRKPRQRIAFAPESFRAHGGHGGLTTDPHLNALLNDLALLFHDRHRRLDPGSRREPTRTDGRTHWTDVGLFLIGTAALRGPLPEAYGGGPLFGSVLPPLIKAFGLGRDALAQSAKDILQARVRRFRRSHGERFASRDAEAQLRARLPMVPSS